MGTRFSLVWVSSLNEVGVSLQVQFRLLCLPIAARTCVSVGLLGLMVTLVSVSCVCRPDRLVRPDTGTMWVPLMVVGLIRLQALGVPRTVSVRSFVPRVKVEVLIQGVVWLGISPRTLLSCCDRCARLVSVRGATLAARAEWNGLPSSRAGTSAARSVPL